MRHSLVLAGTCALLVSACAKHNVSRQAPTQTASGDDNDRPAMPPHKGRGQSASAGEAVYQPAPYATRPTPGNPPGSGTAPGTTKALAPSQGTFIRSRAPLTQYQLQQGTIDTDLTITQRIHKAMEDADNLPADGAAVTVITHGGKAVLFGRVPSEEQRQTIEALARQNAPNVESHIEVIQPEE